MTVLLAFDTATEQTHIALDDGTRLWAQEAAGGAAASALLIPSIEALLASAGLGWSALDAIAYGRGPGAFTGLRTACSVAQGLGFGLGKPVLALDTLMAVAEDARERHALGEVWVAMDARMNEVYAGHYRHDAGGWQVLCAPALYGLDALAARWAAQPPPAVAGTAVEAFGERLPSGAAVRRADALARPAALAALARAAWARGPRLDAAEAMPLYLRDKVALTTAERDARRAATAGHAAPSCAEAAR